MMLLGLNFKANTTFLTQSNFVFLHTGWTIAEYCIHFLTKLFEWRLLRGHVHIFICSFPFITTSNTHAGNYALVHNECMKYDSNDKPHIMYLKHLVSLTPASKPHSFSHHYCSLSNDPWMLKKSSNKTRHRASLPTWRHLWCYSLTTAEPAKQPIILHVVAL